MDARFYSACRDEQWVVDFFASLVARRLSSPGLTDFYRRSLTRLLFGLQRFPRVTSGLSLHLSWLENKPDSAVDAIEYVYMVDFNGDELSFSKAFTVLQYFPGSHHLRDGCTYLRGAERESFLQEWLPWFDELANPNQPLMIEDYSSGKEVDTPPTSELWRDDTGRAWRVPARVAPEEGE